MDNRGNWNNIQDLWDWIKEQESITGTTIRYDFETTDEFGNMYVNLILINLHLTTIPVEDRQRDIVQYLIEMEEVGQIKGFYNLVKAHPTLDTMFDMIIIELVQPRNKENTKFVIHQAICGWLQDCPGGGEQPGNLDIC